MMPLNRTAFPLSHELRGRDDAQQSSVSRLIEDCGSNDNAPIALRLPSCGFAPETR